MIFVSFEDGLDSEHARSCNYVIYADMENDKILSAFSIAPDLEGFNKAVYPNIKDESYDLLPMIKEALSINPDIRIVASAWTAPSWMKDIEDWYIPGSPENNWQGTGGYLKEEYIQAYADYLIKYLKAYQEEQDLLLENY